MPVLLSLFMSGSSVFAQKHQAATNTKFSSPKCVLRRSSLAFEEMPPFHEVSFHHDFSNIPAHGPDGPRPHALLAARPSTHFRSRAAAEAASVQAKLRVGAMDDPLEREADRMAEAVVGTPTATAVENAVSETSAEAIQRKCAACEEDERSSLHRKPADVASQADVDQVPPSVYDVLRSPGRPLDAATRAFMEPRFGRDFGHVRIHDDAGAHDSAHAVRARAYTVGSDVVFGAAQYQPEGAEGRKLLAHELAHVVQQQGAGGRSVQRAPNSESPSQDDAWRLPQRAFDALAVRALEAARQSDNPVLMELAATHGRLKNLRGTLSFSRDVVADFEGLYDSTRAGIPAWVSLPKITFAGPTLGATQAIPVVVVLFLLLLLAIAWLLRRANPLTRKADDEAIRRFLDGLKQGKQGETDPQQSREEKPPPKPSPGPTVDPIPAQPKDPRRECQERHPDAMLCDLDNYDRDEVAIRLLLRIGLGPDDLGDCYKKSSFDPGQIAECQGASGESWHCRVKGTSKEISLFGCLCCDEDGSTGFNWEGEHESYDKSRRGGRGKSAK